MVQFIDFAALSATAPANHPHLIDVTTYDQCQEDQNYEMNMGLVSAFQLWDAVVTLLHTISRATLTSFLDGSQNEFKIVLAKNASNQNQILVWRKGNEILVCNKNILRLCASASSD